MPRKVKQTEPEIVEAKPVEPQPLTASRDDYLRARAVIQLYRENQKNRPKRPCSEKQLAALKAGREKNSRTKKPTPEQDQ